MSAESKSAPAHSASPTCTPIILCVGDSLTARADAASIDDNGPGWLALLRARLSARAHVLNYGVSGYNTKWGQRLLERALQEHTSGTVLLFFGANDAAPKPWLQHIDIDVYATNLTDMVARVRAAGSTPVLIAPPAVCDEMWAAREGTSSVRLAAVTKVYAHRCVQVAKELNVLCVDVHEEMERCAGVDGVARFLCDGVHFNGDGNRLVEEVLVRVLDSDDGTVSPSKLAAPFPPWTDLK